MPLGQILQVGFHAGVNEEADPKQQAPGSLLTLVNARQEKSGRISKRPGCTTIPNALVSGGTIPSASRLRTRNNELCVIDNASGGNQIYSYSPGQSKWLARDFVPEAVGQRDGVAHISEFWLNPDIAYASGLEVYCWQTFAGTPAGTGDIYTTVRDASSGVTVLAITKNTSTNDCVGPKLVILGTTAILVYASYTSGQIIAQTLNLTSPTAWSAPTTLRSDLNVSTSFGVFDTCAVTSTDFDLVYARTGAAPCLQCYRYNASLAQQATGTVGSAGTEPATGFVSLAIAFSTTSLFVTYCTAAPTAKMRVAVLNASSLAVVVAPVTMVTPAAGAETISQCSVAATSSISARVTFNGSSAGSTLPQCWLVLSGSPSLETTIANIGLQSRLFTYSNKYYQVVVKNQTQYLVSWPTCRPVAVVAPRIGNNSTGSGGHGTAGNLGSVVAVSASTFITPGTIISDAQAKGNIGLIRIRYDFADAWIANGSINVSRWLGDEMGASMHMSGGVPSSYDGQSVAEMAFLEDIAIANITLTPSTTGGGLGTGTYLYQFYWEWSDAIGNVHRSNPSTSLSVAVPGPGTTNKVTITVPTLNLTNRGSAANPYPKPYLVVCRTVLNGPAANMYRVTMPDSVTSANINDPTVKKLTIVDTLADGPLVLNPFLYTATGQLENVCPPSLSCIIKHRNRLFGIGDDGRTLWASTQYVPAEAPRWNEILQILFDVPIVALASMDDKLIVFGQNTTWIVFGDGPNELGIQNDWTTPTMLSDETGCIDPRSVNRAEDGIYFQSARGFYKLARNLEMSALKPTMDSLAANPCVNANVNLLNTEAINWACRPVPGNTTGVRIWFDDFHGVWGTDSMTSPFLTSAAVAAMTVWNGAIVWADDQGDIYREDLTTWLDGGLWYNSSFETAWISAAGPMGFSRVRKVQVLGDRFTDHDLKLSLAFDYGSYVQSFQWTAARLATLGKDVVQMRVGSQNGANPRCRAIRIKCELLTPTAGTIGTGQAANLSALGIEIVPKPSMPRLGAANART